MNNHNNNSNALETAATTSIAAASKTPFMTALKITLGIGLGNLMMFAGVLLVLGSFATAGFLLISRLF